MNEQLALPLKGEDGKLAWPGEWVSGKHRRLCWEYFLTVERIHGEAPEDSWLLKATQQMRAEMFCEEATRRFYHANWLVDQGQAEASQARKLGTYADKLRLRYKELYGAATHQEALSEDCLPTYAAALREVHVDKGSDPEQMRLTEVA